MIISEIITALEDILKKHGDIPVLHHDDWDEFLVEKIEFTDEDGLLRVILEGCDIRINYDENEKPHFTLPYKEEKL